MGLRNPCAFKLSSCGISDVGLVRGNNEDALRMVEEHGLFVLADGMGGHKAGEIAAKEAVGFVCTSIKERFMMSDENLNIFELSSFSRLCIENANSWVHHLGQKRVACKGMGTTLCTLLFHEHSIIYGHVGDSRIYRYRKGVLKQLTEDHSLKNQLIAQGQVVEGDAIKYPYKNVLTRAIGTQSEVEAEIHIAPVTPDDIYLMCTDGLTDQVRDDEIGNILSHSPDLSSASSSLVKRANEEGGQDNVTVLMVKVSKQEHDTLL
ncbi:MAG: Serine/threonine phosphatase stp [Chlamydiae bacterium]|nr:Serine/threonine phosphatase stp [Chlamydiota bacterium]